MIKEKFEALIDWFVVEESEEGNRPSWNSIKHLVDGKLPTRTKNDCIPTINYIANDATFKITPPKEKEIKVSFDVEEVPTHTPQGTRIAEHRRKTEKERLINNLKGKNTNLHETPNSVTEYRY